MLKAIKLLLFLFVLLVLLLFFSLFLGVKISSFSLGNVSVSQFYIKLDKKLILTIENIILNDKKTKSESTFEEIKNDIRFLPKILEHFQSIDIENLKFADNNITVKLEDNYLFLDNKFLNIATSFEHSFSNTKFDLYSLYLKEYDFLFDGNLEINYDTNEIKHEGKFFISDVIGDMEINANKSIVDFQANSKYFKNLHFLKPLLKDLEIGEEAQEWMYDNVKGPIKLDGFKARFDLVKNELVEDSLNGKAFIKDALITFNKNVEPIKTTNVDVDFKDGNLYFTLYNPTFKDIPMNGSSVRIENLISEEKGKVIVDIKTKHRLDENIQAILKAFDINLPLIQKDGETLANVILDIPYSYPMKTNGTFKISNSNISINDSFEFYSKSADVVLDGSIVRVKNADFKHKDMIDSVIDLDIDTQSLQATGKAKIKSIFISDGYDEIINVTNTNSKLFLDLNDDVIINLEDLEAYLKIDENINIDLQNLEKLVKYSKLLSDNNIEYGKLFIKVKDFENLDFKGRVFGKDLQLYSINQNNNYTLKELPLDGVIKDSTTILSFNDMILNNDGDKYEISKANVKTNSGKINFKADVKNLDIPLKRDDKLINELQIDGLLDGEYLKLVSSDKTIVYEKNPNKQYANVYLENYNVLINTNEDKEDKEDKEVPKYKLKGKDVNLYLNDKYLFLGDKIDATLDENIVLKLKYGNSEILFEDVYNNNKIFARNLNDKYLNTIFNKDIFLGGIMNLEITGINYELDGKIDLTTSRIKDLAFINNLITFVNTSPALINPLLAIPSVINMLESDGFNLNGYRINKGNVSFKYSPINDKILVKELKTDGNSVDFEGSGIIDLKTDSLDMNLHLIFLKGYSNIVKHLPVVNYLLLGKSNRVDTKVKIIGDISDPKVETNFIKEGINAPIDFGKRILNTPKNLYDSILGNDEEN